jgi:hypothetical protein
LGAGGGGASENDAPDENAATGAPPSVVAFARTYVDIIQIILSRAVAARASGGDE